MSEARDPRPTEASDEAYRDLDTWPLERTLREIARSNVRAAQSVEAASDALAVAAAGIERSLARGGRLVYVGAGTSGRLALQDAAELPPTFGFDRTDVLLAGGSEAQERAREGAEDDAEDGAARIAALEVGPEDAVIGVAASGSTPFTVAAVRTARERGAFTVGIANNARAELLRAAEAGVLLDSGPEVLAGSTRLAAGTAQKIALNALSTAVLVRLGGAYGNLMVGMRPVNDKLRVRAVTIVAQAAAVTPDEARAALERTGWRIRDAILVASGAPPAEARAALERNGERVRDALLEVGSRRS